MAIYECLVCGTIYDEDKEGKRWDQLTDNWVCPVCESGKSYYKLAQESVTGSVKPKEVTGNISGYPDKLLRASDDLEIHMTDIHKISDTGKSIIEPMRTKNPTFSWDEILFKGAQLAKIPLNHDEPVKTKTIIGPNSREPLVIETPIYITHMSFGALSKEVKLALAKGSAAVKTAMCSGEGGILSECMESSFKYIFEYVPNKYSVTEDNLKMVDAIEIKIGQSAKPGMGAHLPAEKVTKEIAAIRGVSEGSEIISPARFEDIKNRDDLKKTVDWLRNTSDGKPIGIKLAAGNVEADLEVALHAKPDFITIDGRAGATGSAPKFVKAVASVPSIFALYRARKFLNKKGLGNEIPFHVFDYPPDFELKMREHINFMINRIASYHQNIKLVHIKLFDLMIEHMRERGNLDKAFELESEKGATVLWKAISASVKPERFVKVIDQKHELKDANLILISGIGTIWPWVRAHSLLNNLQSITDDVSVVMFYPGKYNGQSFRLFDRLDGDNYYRAFRLIP